MQCKCFLAISQILDLLTNGKRKEKEGLETKNLLLCLFSFQHQSLLGLVSAAQLAILVASCGRLQAFEHSGLA